MDITPGKKEESLKPKSAVEDCMLRLAGAIQDAEVDYKALPWHSIRKRIFLQGVLTTLTTVLQLLHDLYHKYDNTDGHFN